MRQRTSGWLVRLACACALFACGGSTNPQALSALSADGWNGIDGSRFTWASAECSDGPLDLARLGFEREVELSVREGALFMTLDTEVITDGCTSTSVWQVVPASDPALWKLTPRALVTLPPSAECGAKEREPQNGSLHLSGDSLEIVQHGSTWCRGFDARFVYRRAPARRLAPRELIARYVAGWNLRDPRVLAGLFVDGGSLVEPFTRTDDGNYARHEGRDALRAFFAQAFASVPWSAMRLLAIEPGTTEGHFTAEWEYMDPVLSEPLRGRNLFVLAGGEIYEAELQLIGDPKAAVRLEPPPLASKGAP
jgi:hypothetical protein